VSALFQSKVQRNEGDSEIVNIHSLLDQGDTKAAEDAARIYVKEHPRSAAGHFLLGLILFRSIQAEARQNIRENDLETASSQLVDPRVSNERARASLAEFTEGAKYGNPSALDLKIVALDYVLLGRYSDASKWLAVSVQYDPKDSQAWYYLGRAKYNENRFDEAIVAFEKCIELIPRNVKAETNLGLAFAGLNHTREAETAFHQAIQWQEQL